MQFRLRSSRNLTCRFLSHKLFKKTDELIWIWRVRCETFQEAEKIDEFLFCEIFTRTPSSDFEFFWFVQFPDFALKKSKATRVTVPPPNKFFKTIDSNCYIFHGLRSLKNLKKKKSNPFIFLYFLLSLTPPPYPACPHSFLLSLFQLKKKKRLFFFLSLGFIGFLNLRH